MVASYQDSSRHPLGRTTVSRIGYGAMQLSSDGAFGPPTTDRSESLAVLRAAVDAGVDHIDTAQYYGSGAVNELIRDALYPYPGQLALVSKVAARRDGNGALVPYDAPHELRQGIEDNLNTLGVEQLTAVNLRIINDAPPDGRFIDQLGAMIQARDDGLIAGIGLSNISLEHLQRALEVTDIVCVQNAFSIANRTSQRVFDECASRGIAFVPFCPLGWPREQHDAILANPVVTAIARAHTATPAQVALAWLLAQSANVLLIAGTTSRSHLLENLAVGTLSLNSNELAELDAQIDVFEQSESAR